MVINQVFQGRYVPLFAAAVYDQNERLKSIGMQSLNLKSIMIGMYYSRGYSPILIHILLGNGLSEWKQSVQEELY